MNMSPDIKKGRSEPSAVRDADRKLHEKVEFILALEDIFELVVPTPDRNDPKTIERLGSLIDRYFVLFRSDDRDDSMFRSLLENLIRTTIASLGSDDRRLLARHVGQFSSLAALIAESRSR